MSDQIVYNHAAVSGLSGDIATQAAQLMEIHDDVLHISGDSPAGRAISAANEGDTVTYRAPNGRDITVAIVAKGEHAFVAA